VRLQASGHDGYAVATLVFESGLIGTLSAGRAGARRIREIVATTTDGEVAVDSLTGAVEVARGEVRERVQMALGDPLLAQAERFLRAVRERAVPDQGLRSAIAGLEVVAAVRECIAVQAATTGAGGVLSR
jgi:predicted dehydrogenase